MKWVCSEMRKIVKFIPKRDQFLQLVSFFVKNTTFMVETICLTYFI